MKNNEKGFTLAEIITVIAILGLLAGIAIPNYINYQYRSNIKTDISTSMEIIRAARIYTILNNNTVADIEDLVLGDYMNASDASGEIIPLTSAEQFALSYDSGIDKYIVRFTTDAKIVGPTYGGKQYEITENGDAPEVD